MKKLIFISGLYGGSAALLKLFNLLLVFWLAKTLPVNEYAKFGLLYALQTGVTAFALSGIIESIVGLLKQFQTQEQKLKLFGAANIAFILLTIVVILLSLLVFFAFSKEMNVSFSTLFYVIFSGVFLAFASLQAQIVRIEEKHVASLSFNFFAPLSGILFGLLFFFINRNLEAFFLGTLIGVLGALFFLMSRKIGVYSIDFGDIKMREIFIRILPFIAVAFLGWISGYGNNYIVKFFFNSSEVAKFTLALSLASVMQMVATALNQVWSPRFYKITHELPFEQVEKENKRFCRLSGIMIGLLGGIIIALFPVCTRFFGGSLVHYQGMSVELFFLFSAYIFLIPWTYCFNYFLAYDKGFMIMRIVIFTSILGITAWFFFIWKFGVIGIYVGFLFQMLIRSVGIVLAAKKIWPLRIEWGGMIFGFSFTLIGLFISLLLK